MKADRFLLNAVWTASCAILVMGCSTVSVTVEVMRPAEISLPGVQTIAIGPMPESELRLSGVRGDPFVDHSLDLREELTRALVRNGFYGVVERSRLDQLFRELKYVLSNHFDSGELQKLGRMAGADAFIYCRFKRNEYTETVQKNPWTDKDKKEHVDYTREGVALVEVYFEIIDVATSLNPAPKSIRKSLSTMEKATDGLPGRIDYEDLLRRCREEVVRQYVKAIAPYKAYENVRFRKGDHPQIDIGISRVRCSDWQGALNAFSMAADSSSDGVSEQRGIAFWNMGLTYCCMGDFEKALDCLNQALTCLPDESEDISRDLFWVRRRQKECQEVQEQQRSRTDTIA